MSERSDPEDPRRQEEIRARQKSRAELPATFVDTWSILRWKGHLRIVLGEWLYRAPHNRFAMVMELGEAEEFAKYILEIIDRQRAEDSGTEPEEPDTDGDA